MIFKLRALLFGLPSEIYFAARKTQKGMVIILSTDLEHLRSGYAELTAEFRKMGADIVADIPPKSVDETLGEKNFHTENTEKFLGVRAAEVQKKRRRLSA